MPHEVETMMYVGEAPWHGLGVRLDRPPTAEEAIRAAGLDWKVECRPILTYGTPNAVEEARLSEMVQCERHQAVVRMTDNRVLGVVSKRWEPLQNQEAFAFFDPFVRSGRAEYHTAGSLRNGGRVWVLAKVNAPQVEVVPGDPLERYFLLSNGHDGKHAVMVSFTTIRVVCANTLGMAEVSAERRADKALWVMHTQQMAESLTAIQDIVDLENRTFAANLEAYRFLASRQVRGIESFFTQVLNPPKAAEVEGEDSKVISLDEARDRGEPKALPQLIELFERGRGQHNPHVVGSWWAAVNAVTEWVDHQRGRDFSRLDSAWFGEGRRIKARALESAMHLATAA